MRKTKCRIDIFNFTYFSFNNFIYYKCFLGNENKIVISEQYDDGWAFEQGASTTHKKKLNQEKIQMKTIDEIISNNHDSEKISAIKIDVDGSESEIIAGMRTVMSDDRLKTIMIEIDDNLSQGEIERTIGAYGLEEVMVEQWGEKNTFNKLFVRK